MVLRVWVPFRGQIWGWDTVSAGQALTGIIPSFSGRVREDDFQCIRDSGGYLCVCRTIYWIDGYHRAAEWSVLRLRLHMVVWLEQEL